MRLPRDLSGAELAAALGRLGYQTTRRSGSHIRLSRSDGGEHHITIPDHNPLKVGTLASILRDVAAHVGLPREEIVETLFA